METALVLTSHAVPDAASPSRRLVGVFFSGKSPKTIDAYRRDLEDFRSFVGVASIDEAARVLLSGGHGPANETGLRYRADLLERRLSPATVNRHLAALRSLVKLARTLGLVPWALEVPSVESRPYRDTKGPGLEGFRALLALLDKRLDEKGSRDRAVLHLLFDLALRREEAVHLDLEDLNLKAGTVAVLGKKRTEKETLTLPEPTKAALSAWLEARGTEPGPLFGNFDRAGKGSRLTGRSVHRLVRDLGLEAGLGVVRPHGLRHAAITEALDLTGGNVRAVQRFSRHRDVRVLATYDDNRKDLGGDVARLVAGRAAIA
jgi:integrase/recombinase XerC